MYSPDLETTGEALNIDLLPTLKAHAVLSALHGQETIITELPRNVPALQVDKRSNSRGAQGKLQM